MTLPLRRIAIALAVCLPALCATAAAAAPLPTLVVGDSLAVGMRPGLDALVPGRAFSWDVRSGRTTPQGLLALRARLTALQPAAVVISLGTNDGPDPARFADRIRRVLAAVGPQVCVVWPSIVRPPRKGEEGGLNRTLRRLALEDPRLVVVDWDGAVRSGRVRLPDGLHPDAAGYGSRSRMVAAALREGCAAAPGDEEAPPDVVEGSPTGGAQAP